MGNCRKSTAPLFHPAVSATYASLLATRAKPYCAGFSGLICFVLKERCSKSGGKIFRKIHHLPADETGGQSDDFGNRDFKEFR